MIKDSVIFWTAIVLAIVGAVDTLINGYWLNWFIPVAIIAAVFLLYKFGPGQARSSQPKIKPSARTMAKTGKAAPQRRPDATKRRNYPFQVIEGQKGKNSDPDQPKYH
ncbi:hypothetical protein J2Z69_000440 [Paenibacillus shirakamiensis]|uniref:DUF5668 domain-containing protein n=1 Tax=Paenibacillus shirakamiensis TaxID=1265935 RepID=A0ABS4JEN1_9BACL|nr:hypothetical protein [Paenibacillus shirakamiensis]MBP1999421.1 hypothetical protein [Paenibacillus shirakamiensis]